MRVSGIAPRGYDERDKHRERKERATAGDAKDTRHGRIIARAVMLRGIQRWLKQHPERDAA